MKTEGFDKAFHDEVGKIVNPILEKAASETFMNHTLVGSPKLSTSSYNPHNIRLYFAFEKVNFEPKLYMVGGRFVSPKSNNCDSEIQFTDSVTTSKVTVKRKLIEIRYKIGYEDWYIIHNSNAGTQIREQILARIRQEATLILKEFVNTYGGKTDYKIVREYMLDNKVKNNSLTNKLRERDIFETPILKKVYFEKSAEYKNVDYAIRCMENAGLYDFSDQICDHLKLLYTLYNDKLAKEPVTFSWLMENVKSVEEGMKYRRDTENLTFDERWELANKIRGDINFQWKRIEKVVL